MRRSSKFRSVICASFLLLPLLSVAAAEVEIHVDKGPSGTVVRSAADAGNFLFRAPAGFARAAPAPPFLVRLDGPDGARIRLRRTRVGPGDQTTALETLAGARAADYRLADAAPKLVDDSARLRAISTREGRVRTVLLVRDGPYLYEVFVDRDAADDGPDGALDGFTILAPKGSKAPVRVPPPAVAETVTHDYYKITVLKPAGFVEQAVNPNADKGIYLHLRRLDEQNLADIKVRVHLARTLKRSVEEIAASARDEFGREFRDARLPKRLPRTGVPGGKEAYKLVLTGKAPKSGIVVRREVRVIHHENGRVYEIEVTLYAGALRAFRKDVRAFWKTLKFKAS